jgi:arginase
VGDERAETYLRVLAESELRRAGTRLRLLDAAAGTDVWSPPDSSLFVIAERAQWKVGRTGRILLAVGVLDQEALDSATGHFFDAIQARSRLLLNWYRSRGVLHRTIFAPAVVQPPPRPADPDMRVTPIGLTLDVAGEHAPSTVHLMSLVATATEALITVVMRMHWPADGSSPDLEITGAGPHHLPYDRFWAVDDEGTRYTARFEAGYGETAAWRGVIQLSPVPPRHARWLDLTGDGTPVVRLVVAHRDAPVPAGAPELFAPLAAVLPDAGGAWIAVAGLSSAAGQSHLHLVTIGLPPVADRFAYNWTPGYSWWLTDGGGNWHVGTACEPWTFGDGTQAFRLRLTPALTAIPDAAELVLTGPSTRVRVRFPVIGPGLRSARSRITVEASMRPLIVEVPSPLGLRPSGVELAPAALRAAGLHARLGCDDAQHVAVPPYDDRRDRATGVLNPGGIADVAFSLAGVIESALQASRLPVVLGGDCSIVLGPLLALRRRGRYGLVFLDGHADFQHPADEPNGEVASLDLALATGRGPRPLTDLDGLAPLVRAEDVALVGYRVFDDNDRFGNEHVRDSGITVLDYHDLRAGTIPLILDRALAIVTRPWLQGFWVHLDVDVLDDVIMPAVDYRHPGGLSWDEAAQLLQGLLGLPGARGLDVTIFNPNLDPDGSIVRQLCELIARCVPAAG